ncbi:MAG: hypothetical protein JETCAE03_35040 [Ignavibacteriaceae bacterium]|jgi:very-short-patch-repair endonuclease|nr:MAG: hypothetical protein JETCAE03_35040 [Ignavibacteriaceae bacterium]
MEYERQCPDCFKTIKYKDQHSFKRAEKHNRKCHLCSHKNPWNKGKTKESDKRVEKYSKTLSQTLKGSIPWNKNKKLHYNVWNKGKTKEIDPRIKGWLKGKKLPAKMVKALVEGRRKYYERHPEVKSASRVRISKPQRLLFEECKKHFNDVKLEYYHKGYFIDILIDNKLAIEVDGAHWHTDKEYDRKRDKIISKTYKVLRFDAEYARENRREIVEKLSLL